MPKRAPSSRKAAVAAMVNNGTHVPEIPNDPQSPPEKKPTSVSYPPPPQPENLKSSDNIDKLTSAIIAVNKLVRLIGHDGQAYSNSYTTLAHIISTIDEPLTKNGLTVLQFPLSYGTYLGVTTRVCHTSGQWIEGSFLMPIPYLKGANITQQAGAAITYARRYAILAILGIVADKDTDANYDE